MGTIMKTRIFNIILVAMVALGSIFTSCSDDADSFVLRSDDNLNFTYAQDSKEFTVCTNGDWNITSDCDWLTFSVTQGKGDGTTREKVIVTADRNISNAREAEFVLHAAGKDLPVSCSQAEGAPLTLGQAKVSGSLQAGQEIDQVNIEIPYAYGYKGEELSVSATLSGAGADGIVASSKHFTLDASEGTLLLPLSGTPVTSGPLVIKIETDEPTANTVVAQTSVLSKVILEQHFDLMLWGGDVVANKAGVQGVFMAGDGGKVIDPSQPVAACKATTDGSNDLILTMSESYRQLRGFSGWGGAKIYEHPGYVKMGTASVIGRLITPALGTLSEGVSSVKVTCRVAQYNNESGGRLTIMVLNGGTPSIATYTYKNAGTKTGGTWEDVSFTVDGVNSETKIQFSTEGNMRFCMDNIVISEGK